MSSWDITADGIIVAAGVLVLFGSAAQAAGDLRQYQDLYHTFKATAKDWRGRYLAEEDLGWVGQLRQLVLLIRIAFSTSGLVESVGSGRGPGTEPQVAAPEQPDRVARSEHGRVEQAVNSAAGWSLILLGSVLAIAAAAIQLCLLIVR